MSFAKYAALIFTFFGLLFAGSCSKQSPVSKHANEDTSSLVIIKSSEPENNHSEDTNYEHRQLGAHVHGAASMNLALENGQLNIAMSIPGMDAVGFEHAAASSEDQAKLNEVLNYLQKPAVIFVTPIDAECQLIKGEISTALLNKEDKSNSHADVDVSYQWQCKNSSALKFLEVKLFSHLSHLQKIKASWISTDRQGAAELTPAVTLLILE